MLLNKTKNISIGLICLLLIILLIFSIVSAVNFGPVNIDFNTTWNIIINKIFLHNVDKTWSLAREHIIWDIRLPRVILGAVVGAGLSIVGVAMQSLVKNPLADPYILGISSGASTGATFVILIGGFSIFGQYGISFAAFLGALISAILVFCISQIKGKATAIKLLLTGVAVSSLFSSITNFIVFSAKNEGGMKTALFWMMGSLAGTKWAYIPIPIIFVAISGIYLLIYSRQLNSMLVGEETAVILGVDTNSVRKAILIITSMVTGVIVSVSGCIGFVGFVIPHIVRSFIGSDHRKVIPISALIGSVFIIWVDVGARVLAAPEELPIGIITSFLGAPFFIWLLISGNASFGSKDD